VFKQKKVTLITRSVVVIRLWPCNWRNKLSAAL